VHDINEGGPYKYYVDVIKLLTIIYRVGH